MIKKLLTNSKVKIAGAITVLSTACLTVPTFADTLDLTTPIQTAMQTTVTNTISIFSAIIPIGLTIFGARFAWEKGVQFFASIAKK